MFALQTSLLAAVAAPAQVRASVRAVAPRRNVLLKKHTSLTVKAAAAAETETAEAEGKPEKMALTAVTVGNTYKGIVRSIQTYGAFIDIGATSDGLAHVSELSAAFVKDPKDVLTVGQEVDARVLSVDADKGRFALSLKKEGEVAPRRERSAEGADGEGRQQRRGKVARAPKRDQKKVETTLKVGETVTGKVVRVLPYGAFVLVQEGVEGLLHQSEVSTTEIEPNLKMMFKEDQEVEVRVISVDNNKVSLTTKSEEERKPFKGASAEIDPASTKTVLEYQMARLGLSADMFPKASA